MNHNESIFESVSSRNKIYCIEASALTHNILPYIKNHVINNLQNKSHHGDSMKFNLICFNSDVAKWCVSMAPCTTEYITAAADWLRHILPEGSCNFLGALISALKEPLSCNICFIVTQQSDQNINEILDFFAFVGRKIPCHIRLCLHDNEVSEESKNAQTIYSQVARETHGTFAFVRLNSKNELVIMQSAKNILNSTGLITVNSYVNSSEEENENIKKLELLRDEEKRELFSPFQPFIPVTDSFFLGKQSDDMHYKPFHFWKRVSASQSYLDCMRNFNESNISRMAQENVSKLAASVIVGREVLARKYTNGQYYLGYIKDQVNNELFNVVFGPYNWGTGQFVATDYQQTKLLDLIDFNDAMKRSILPGDRVLAPDPTNPNKDAYACRYLTGTVLHGSVIREYTTAKSHSVEAHDGKNIDTPIKTSDSLIVEFTNPLNKTEKVLSDKVICIPEPFFQRLVLESTMPKSAREKLYKVPNYPLNSLPGYPTSGSKKRPDDYTFTNLNVMKSRTLQVDYLMPPYCLPLYPVVEIFDKDERTGNVLMKSDWAVGNVVKKSSNFKKDETMVPESIYTISELQLKVKDQLETFKSLPQVRINSEKSFYRRGLSKKFDNDAKLAKSVHIKSNEKLLTSQKSNLQDKKIRFSPETESKLEPKSKIDNKSTVTPYAIHEEYFDDIQKIRENMDFDQVESVSSSVFEVSDNKQKKVISFADESSKEKIGIQPGILFQNKISNKPVAQNSNVLNITDLGQKDKEKEFNEKMKLERHQRQIQKRLDEEKHKFCKEEIAKDKQFYFHRLKTADRLYKENMIFQREQEAINNAQSLKRAILTEVENKVKPINSVPVSYDDIDQKRIEYLRKRMEIRNNETEQRNQNALKYVEKLEMNKRNQNDERWWKAQNQMLNEYKNSV